MNRKYWFLLIILTIIPILSLLRSGLPITHDGGDHVARIASFYQSLSEGNLVPHWAGNLNWGYGHPILMFLYPLPSYAASMFHFLGFSFVDSTKLVFAVFYLLSALSMYLWSKEMWGARAGFIAALVYVFSPYRFVDLYVRGAIGEHAAFVFPPIIFYALLALGRNKKRTWIYSIMLAAGVAGLILSHNAVSLMFLPIIGLYTIYVALFEAKRKKLFMVLCLWFIALGFLLSAFFWMPAYIEGKYTLRDIVTFGGVSGRFVNWTWLFYSPWNYGTGNEFTKQVGIMGWLGAFGCIWLLFRKNIQAAAWFIRGSLVIFFISLFLMTDWSLFIWNIIPIMQKFQFPWRFLSVTVFISSVLVGFVASKISKQKMTLLVVVAALVALVGTRDMWWPKGYVEKPENFYSGVYEGTTDTGESSPIWSVRFMEHRPNAWQEVIEGQARITPLTRTSVHHTYSVDAKTKSRILENTLYFPGWTVAIDNKKVRLQEISFQDPQYRGLMTFWVEPGVHTVTVVFGNTKVRRVAMIISIVGILMVLASTVGLRKRNIYEQ